MSFVKVKNLSKSYKNNEVFKNISVDIEKGDFVTLLGPSGCGKTTLLRCIAGLETINAGEIFIDDNEISKLRPKDRNVGMVFQSYALFPNMTVEENLAFGLKMNKVSKSEIKTSVEEMISMLELNGKEKSYPNELSGGQAQRVALARTLIMKPKVLLLDEPLSALDAKIRKSIRLEIRNLQKKLNITTIFVTHDQEEALIISDKIFVMDKGNISQAGTPEEIYASPQNEFVANFIGNYNVITIDTIKRLYENPVEGELFALRPEALYIYEENSQSEINENEFIMKGTIHDLIILGNIIRFFVQISDNIIIVDDLNRQENYKKIGTKVDLLVKMKDCVKIK